MLTMFDIDGTLIRSFLRKGEPNHDYNDVEALPGRAVRIAAIAVNPHARFALITNEAGVAMGYQSIEQVNRKIGLVLATFNHFHGRPVSVHVCFRHQNGKPGPGMLLKALNTHHTDRSQALYVGDMDTDQQAAANANMPYSDAHEFFDALS